MDINDLIIQLKNQFGDRVDGEKIRQMFKGKDMSKLSMKDALETVKTAFRDLDGDGKEEGLIEELKGKASQILGGFGSMFGKK